MPAVQGAELTSCAQAPSERSSAVKPWWMGRGDARCRFCGLVTPCWRCHRIFVAVLHHSTWPSWPADRDPFPSQPSSLPDQPLRGHLLPILHGSTHAIRSLLLSSWCSCSCLSTSILLGRGEHSSSDKLLAWIIFNTVGSWRVLEVL